MIYYQLPEINDFYLGARVVLAEDKSEWEKVKVNGIAFWQKIHVKTREEWENVNNVG